MSSRARLPPLLFVLGGVSLLGMAVYALRSRVAPERTAELPSPRVSDVPPPQPSTADRQALESLHARLLQPRPRFRPEETGPATARRVLHLAEFGDDPRVVRGAIEALPSFFAPRSPSKPVPGADFERVLLKHLGSKNAETMSAALGVVWLSLAAEDPSPRLVGAVAAVAAPDEPAPKRAAALQALNTLRSNRRSNDVLGALELSLKAPEAHLVSLALLALAESGPSLATAAEARQEALGARVVGLSDHSDPGVRGRALLVLAALPELVDPETRIASARGHLGDEHPYVRAQAADLLARCERPEGIHDLVAHVQDLERATYVLSGWTALDGSQGSLTHQVAGRPRVADAMIFAVQSLSAALVGIDPLTVSLGGRPAPDELVRENGRDVEAWYRGNAPRVPRWE